MGWFSATAPELSTFERPFSQGICRRTGARLCRRPVAGTR